MNKTLLRASLVALLSVGLLGGCSTISKTTDTVAGWFSFGKKRVAQPAPLPDFAQKRQLSRAWGASASEAGNGSFVPAGDGNAVFAAGESGRVVRLNLQNGNETWQADTGRKLTSGVGLGAGLVLVGGLKGELIALDAASGAKRWEVSL